MGSEEIHFGFWNSHITAPVLQATDTVLPFAQTIDIPSHPQVSRGTYLNGSPYTRLLLDCYGFGQIPLDASIFAGTNKLTLSIGVDAMSGVGRISIYAGTDPKLIYRAFAPVGVEMKIGQATQGLISAPLQVMVGGAGLSYGNVIGFGAGLVSGLESLMPQLATQGSVGAKSAYTNAPSLIIERCSLPAEDITNLGRPLCAPTVINTLSGYIQCENVEIDLIATRDEATAIRGYLEGGFFYE